MTIDTPFETPLLLPIITAPSTDLLSYSFIYVMKFMGDYMAKGKTEIDVVHFLLLAAQKHDQLRDEICCQLLKQITNNKSERAEVS